MKPVFETARGKLYQGDALEALKQLPNGSAELVVLDPPYVAFRDSRIGKDDHYWKVQKDLITQVLAEVSRVVKRDQPVFLFGLPSFYLGFADAILENFRVYFDIIWEKSSPTNPLLAKIRPMNIHEQILVLVRKDAKVTKMKYHPMRLGTRGHPPVVPGGTMGPRFGGKPRERKAPPDFRYPKTIVHFNNFVRRHGHPTEKPVSLMEWLIKGWTDEGDLVLDPFAGSGSTLISAEKLNRRWIGIEISPEYCELIKRRFEREVKDIAKVKPLDEFMGGGVT